MTKFSRYFGRSPDRLGFEDVRAYQLHLITQHRSWSHVNQAFCALRFFYGVTPGQPEAFERIAAAREPQKLPVILAADEIVRFLEAVPFTNRKVPRSLPPLRWPYGRNRGARSYAEAEAGSTLLAQQLMIGTYSSIALNPETGSTGSPNGRCCVAQQFYSQHGHRYRSHGTRARPHAPADSEKLPFHRGKMSQTGHRHCLRQDVGSPAV
ncbi:MAG: phage integrase N-terminal SAM-like domain-containing protein [Acidiphilium sp.]